MQKAKTVRKAAESRICVYLPRRGYVPRQRFAILPFSHAVRNCNNRNRRLDCHQDIKISGKRGRIYENSCHQTA